MTSTYALKLTNGSELATVYPFESNGVNNKSVPRPVTIDRSGSPPAFVLTGDFSDRFVDGFEFEIIGGTVYDGRYSAFGESVVTRGNTYVFVDFISPDPLPSNITSSNPIAIPEITYHVPAIASSLKLVGQGSSMYNTEMTWGHSMQLNLLHMLENFASDKPPVSPVSGQLWYETNSKRLRIFDGLVFADVSPEQRAELFTQANADKLYVSTGGGQLTGSLILASNPSDPLEAATKQYVDSLANGIVWVVPILDPNLFDDSLSSPPDVTPDVSFHRTYIVKDSGKGEWKGLDNHAVYHDGGSWISVLGRPVKIGDRFGIFIEPDAALLEVPTAGSLVARAGSIATVVSVDPIRYAFEEPIEPDAVTVKGTSTGSSPYAGFSFTFRGTYGLKQYGLNYRWIEFSGPQLLVVGSGLRYVGNVLTFDTGFTDSKYGRRISSAPENSDSPGKAGDWFADDDFMYTYGATGWRRVATHAF